METHSWTFEKVGTLAKAIIASATGLGIFTVFCFCAFQAHFFPTGLNVGDSLFFLFVAFMFGLTYLLWLTLGCGAIHRLAGIKGHGIVSLVCTVILISIAFSVWPAFALRDFVITFVGVLGGGFLIALGARSWSDPHMLWYTAGEHRRRALLVVTLGLLFPALFSAVATSRMQRGSLSFLGVYVDHAQVIASADEYAAIKSVATELGAPIFGCSVEGSKDHTVYGLRVWWHGVGERSLLGIPKPGDPSDDVATVEVKRDGIRVVKVAPNTPVEACFPLDARILFGSGTSQLSATGTATLTALVASVNLRLKASKLTVKGASVLGHADRSVPATPGLSNQGLSEARAKTVADFLKASFSLTDKALEIKGDAATTASDTCSTSLAAVSLQECRALDRRVDIRLYLSPES